MDTKEGQRKIAVLFVDDEPDLLQLCQDFLERIEDLEIHTSLSARDALQKMSQERYDVIVSDFEMPDMNGIQFLREVRYRDKDIPFILFTGRGRESIVIEALNSGATFYLQKGADAKAQFHELVHKVRIAISKYQTEKSLRYTQDLMDSLMAQSKDGLIFVDSSGRIIEWSRAQTEFTGITREEAVGNQASEVIARSLPPEECDQDPRLRSMEDLMAYLKAREEDWTKTFFERVMVDGSGRKRTVQIMLFPIQTGKGQVMVNIVRDVTFLKQAEMERDQVSEQFRQLIESIHDGVLQIDENGTIILCNPEFLRISGQSREQIIGKPIWEMVWERMSPERRTPQALERLKNDIKASLMSGTASWINRPMELTYHDSKAPVKHVMNTIYPIKTSKGFSMWGVYTDITERKLMLERLQASEYKYRGLVENSTEGIALFDEGLRLIEWNMAMVSITGYSADEVIGQDFLGITRLMAPDPIDFNNRKDDYQRMLSEALANGRSPVFDKHIDTEMRRKDDRKIWVRQVAFPIKTTVGHRMGVIIREITTERENLNRVHSEMRYNRGLIETNPDPIMLISSDGTVADTNVAAASALGYRKDEVIGKPFSSFIADMPSYEKADRTLTEEGYVRNMELEMRNKDGTVQTFLTNGSLIKTADGMNVGMVIAFKDITELLQARRKLEELNKKLSILATITRHDISNKLTIVQGNLDLVERACHDKEKVAPKFAQMRNALDAINEQFLMAEYYQEMGSKRPEWFELDHMLHQLVIDMEQWDIKVHLDVRGVEILADPLLDRVFNNLADNSCRHGLKVRNIWVSFVEEDGVGRIVYRDDGMGVPADIKERIFEMGFGKHTGLGLATSRDILGLTGMTIKEVGVPGEGAEFQITVPKGSFRYRSGPL